MSKFGIPGVIFGACQLCWQQGYNVKEARVLIEFFGKLDKGTFININVFEAGT
jgi:hypothetical protein